MLLLPVDRDIKDNMDRRASSAKKAGTNFPFFLSATMACAFNFLFVFWAEAAARYRPRRGFVFKPVNYAGFFEVVGSHLDFNLISHGELNEVFAELAGYMG